MLIIMPPYIKTFQDSGCMIIIFTRKHKLLAYLVFQPSVLGRSLVGWGGVLDCWGWLGYSRGFCSRWGPEGQWCSYTLAQHSRSLDICNIQPLNAMCEQKSSQIPTGGQQTARKSLNQPKEFFFIQKIIYLVSSFRGFGARSVINYHFELP